MINNNSVSNPATGSVLGEREDGPPNLRWELPMHPSPQYFEKQCYWMRGKVRSD